MSQVVSLRLPDHTAERLRAMARRAGRTLNEAAARSLEEWLRQEEFAEIEFRNFAGERHACLKGALPVWQLVFVAKDFAMDARQAAAYFDFPLHRVQAALNYYEAYPEEIELALADNDTRTFDTLKRLLPRLEAISIPRSVLEGEGNAGC